VNRCLQKFRFLVPPHLVGAGVKP